MENHSILSLPPPPSSSWEPPNAQYWAQFHGVRPQGPGARQQQHQHNQRVLGYCLLLMLAGMGLHYAAFRCVPGLPGVGRRAEGGGSPVWPADQRTPQPPASCLPTEDLQELGLWAYSFLSVTSVAFHSFII